MSDSRSEIMDTKLLPCPFCTDGGDPFLSGTQNGIVAVCRKCGSAGPSYFDAAEPARAAWNRRIERTAQAQGVTQETLYEALKHGDELHRRWLREALAAVFSRSPVPPPYDRNSVSATAIDATIRNIVRAVAELPDRDSPDDWPEAMLVTDRELINILTAALNPEAST
jgi:hypothetical protein